MNVNDEYAIAYAEVCEVLNKLTKEGYEKIPRSYIEVLEENKCKTHSFHYDTTKSFEEQNISDEAQYILFGLFEKFWATPEQREKIVKFREQALKKSKLETYKDLIEGENN